MKPMVLARLLSGTLYDNAIARLYFLDFNVPQPLLGFVTPLRACHNFRIAGSHENCAHFDLRARETAFRVGVACGVAARGRLGGSVRGPVAGTISRGSNPRRRACRILRSDAHRDAARRRTPKNNSGTESQRAYLFLWSLRAGE